jgi:hypothetical protein
MGHGARPHNRGGGERVRSVVRGTLGAGEGACGSGGAPAGHRRRAGAASGGGRGGGTGEVSRAVANKGRGARQRGGRERIGPGRLRAQPMPRHRHLVRQAAAAVAAAAIAAAGGRLAARAAPAAHGRIQSRATAAATTTAAADSAKLDVERTFRSPVWPAAAAVALGGRKGATAAARGLRALFRRR